MKKPKKERTRSQTERRKVSGRTFDWPGILIVVATAGLLAAWFIFEGTAVVMGLFLGLLIALASLSYLGPMRWPQRPFITSLLGGAIGFIAAVEGSAGSGFVVLAVLVGAIVGLFASHLVKYISLP